MQYFNKSNGVTIEVSKAVFERDYAGRGYEPVEKTVETKKGKSNESVS